MFESALRWWNLRIWSIWRSHLSRTSHLATSFPVVCMKVDEPDNWWTASITGPKHSKPYQTVKVLPCRNLKTFIKFCSTLKGPGFLKWCTIGYSYVERGQWAMCKALILVADLKQPHRTAFVASIQETHFAAGENKLFSTPRNLGCVWERGCLAKALREQAWERNL